MLQQVKRAVFLVGFLGLSTVSCSSDNAPVAPGDNGGAAQTEQLFVSLNVDRDSIAYGAERQFSARVHNQFNVARVAAVTWRSTNSDVVTVTSGGSVSAIGAGTAQLIASIPNGAADTATVSVYGVIETLSVIPEVVSIPEGDTIRFEADYGLVQGAAESFIKWSTTDSAVAKVDAVGRMAALQAGDVELVAQYGRRSARAAVRVFRAAVASIIISPSASTIQPGGSVTLSARLRDVMGHTLGGRDVEWTSSSTDVATVSQSGVVTGVAKGFTLITATSEGRRATASVTVGPRAVTSVSVSLDNKSIVVGQQTTAHATVHGAGGVVIPFTEQPVAWQSSNPSIATVSSTGQVNAIAIGNVTISAISGGRIGSDGATIQGSVAQSISISPTAPSVLQGTQTQLTAVVRDQSGTQVAGAGVVVTWQSGNASVATISSTGVVSGVSAGTSTITVSTGSLLATAVLTVTPVPVASLSVSPSSVTLDIGGTKALSATPRDAQGNWLTGRVVAWSTSNPTVATVSNDGLVTALGQGAATIAASSEGKTSAAQVAVNPPAPAPVASVTVVLNSPSIEVDQSTSAVATVRDASGHVLTGRTITWTSSAPEVATVTSTGMVTGVSAGSVTIIATSDGKTGVATLTVNPPPAAPVATVLLSLSPSQIAKGGTAQTQVTLKDAGGHALSGRAVGYSSSRSSVATVANSGTVTGMGVGTANIRALSEGVSSSAPVTVTSGAAQPASLTITAPTTVLTPGQTVQLTGTVRDAAGNALSGYTIIWESYDKTVATIDATGLVTAVAPGSVTIESFQSQAAWNTLGLTVQADTSTPPSTPAPVAAVNVSLNASSLAVGQSTQAVTTTRDSSGKVLTGRSIVYTSSSLSVATVTQAGVVTAVAAGTAQIVAVSEGKQGSATVTVTAVVTPPPPPPPSTPPGASPTNLATLPQSLVDTHIVAPTGKTITVNAGGNLQSAINSAVPGDVIVLQAGATFTGSFTLPNKSGSGWVTIRTSASDAQLPPGSRVTPTMTSLMPKIVSPGINQPAIYTLDNAHNYRLIGLEITIVSGAVQQNSLLTLGTSTQSASQMPQQLIVDRSYIHGNSTQELQRCILMNSGATAVIDSWLGECHSSGQDSQAIEGWNGSGPYLIQNNHLEGAGENVMFGGAPASISNLTPSDIVIRHNYFYKPTSWQGKWSVKNLFELKNAQRVLVEGNIFDGSWQDGQTGSAFNMKSSGDANEITQDVTIRYNIVRNSGGGMAIAGMQGATQRVSSRYYIHDNILEKINTGVFQGHGKMFQIVDGPADLLIEHNTLTSSSAYMAIGFSGNPVARFTFRNNVISRGQYGIKGDGTVEGTGTLTQYTPGMLWEQNVLLGSSGNSYPSGTLWSTDTAIGFTNVSGSNYTLQSSSPVKGVGSDGRDPGADVAQVLSATAGAIVP